MSLAGALSTHVVRARERVVRLIKHAGWRQIRRIADAAGVDVLLRHYYSPIPDVAALPAELWEHPAPLRGLCLDTERHFAFLEDELAPHVAEFHRRLAEGRASGFTVDNPTYRSVDAEVLYAMVRHAWPRRIVELGSGHSSKVIRLACQVLQETGAAPAHRAFDPYAWLPEIADLVTPTSATDVPLEEFASLEAGDILFVDTTHTVKVGSDVNHIVLQVLPALAPGVLVHFHDIFLPWEYPREWITDAQFYWAEQYLLQAFLAFNDRFEVIWASHAAARTDPLRLMRSVPSFTEKEGPSAFWIRRRS